MPSLISRTPDSCHAGCFGCVRARGTRYHLVVAGRRFMQTPAGRVHKSPLLPDYERATPGYPAFRYSPPGGHSCALTPNSITRLRSIIPRKKIQASGGAGRGPHLAHAAADRTGNATFGGMANLSPKLKCYSPSQPWRTADEAEQSWRQLGKNRLT
jgi:hypothetical protein